MDKQQFYKCVNIKENEDDSVEITCKLGLWSVGGLDSDIVENEALRYWAQYYMDGEYDEQLKEN